MKILLLHGTLVRGGIETLIVRLAEYLVQCGHEVELLLLFGSGEPELLREFKRFGRILRTGAPWEFPLLFQRTVVRQMPDRILSFGMNSLLHALIISQRSNLGAPIAAAIYFPRELCWKSTLQSYRQLLVRRVVAAMPTRNLAFVSDAAKREHCQCLGTNLDQSRVLPIPVNTARFKHAARTPKKNKIVSIGRLVDFKTYNWIILDVIEQLRLSGVDVDYHVYGDGPKREFLAHRISEKRLGAFVHLHGGISYDSFSEVLRDAAVFVGMGTSLIEAAACGVPSLVAIESCAHPYTYGLFHKQKTPTIGDIEHGRTVVHLADALREILGADRANYEGHCLSSKQAADLFSMKNVCPSYLEFLGDALPFTFAFGLKERIVEFVDLVRWEVRRGLHLKTPFDARYEGPRVSIADNHISLV